MNYFVAIFLSAGVALIGWILVALEESRLHGQLIGRWFMIMGGISMAVSGIVTLAALS
jgi:hypothetical protein